MCLIKQETAQTRRLDPVFPPFPASWRSSEPRSGGELRVQTFSSNVCVIKLLFPSLAQVPLRKQELIRSA